MPATATPPLPADDARFFAAARLRAARMQPYLACAVFSLVPVLRPGLGTFAVDRWWRVYLDMDTARAWGVEATAAVLLHETHHVVRDHHDRADRLGVDASDAELWNLAGDAAINDDLVADGLPLPDPVLPQHLGAEENQLEEAYYRLLVRRGSDRRTPTCGSGSGAAPSDTEIGEAPDDARAERDGLDDVDAAAVRRDVAHEVDAAQRRGEPVPGGLVRWAEQLLSPQVPWRTLLRGAFRHAVRAQGVRTHDDWTRPDRRADVRGDTLHPGSRRHRPEVAVVVDTSASMSAPLLDAAVTELDALIRRGGCRELTVVVCDAEAVRPQRVRRIQRLELRGGGGTDLRIGIDAAAAVRPTPEVIVVLTDGWTPWPTEAPARSRLVAVVIGDEAPLPSGRAISALRIAEPT